MNIQELKEQRAKVIQSAKVIIESAEGDGRDLTEEEQAQFDAMMEQAEELQDQADTAERKLRLQTAEDGLKVSKRQVKLPQPTGIRPTREDRDLFPEVVRQWMLAGTQYSNPTPEVFRAAERLGVNFNSHTIQLDLRTQTKGTAADGGYTVPQGFGDRIVEHLKYVCPIRDYATVLTTENGIDVPYPINDDVANVGAIFAEGAEITDTDTTFSQKTLKAYKYGSAVKVSVELLQDSKFNLEEYLSAQLGKRIGRKQETDFMVGDGSGKATGLVPSASSGVTSWTTTFANLNSLYWAVDREYRGKGVWFMHDTVAAAIRALVDDNGRPLLEMNNALDAGDIPTLFGRPVVISNSMDASGSSKRVIVFGDPSDFIIRDVGSVTLFKSEHRYAELGIVGFWAWLRSDSNWLGSARALKCGITAS